MTPDTENTIRRNLEQDLQDFPPIPNLEEEVYAAIGARPAELAGYHTFVASDRVAVYMITPNCLGIFEADETGRTLVLTVDASRIRRVIRSEAADKTNLTIELEAGQYQSITDPTGNVSTLPAGYELGETGEKGRQSLRNFQIAISRILND